MAIRNIVKDTDGYDTLHKKCRPVTEFNQKLWTLLDDMAQTMYGLLKAGGVPEKLTAEENAQTGVCH